MARCGGGRNTSAEQHSDRRSRLQSGPLALAERRQIKKRTRKIARPVSVFPIPKSAQSRISSAGGRGKVSSRLVAHTAARVRSFEAQSHAPLASSETRNVARTVRSRRSSRASRSSRAPGVVGPTHRFTMGLIMRKNDRSFSSGGAPSPKKARLGSFVDLSRGARESSIKPHVLDNGTRWSARGNAPRARRQRASSRRSNATPRLFSRQHRASPRQRKSARVRTVSCAFSCSSA